MDGAVFSHDVFAITRHGTAAPIRAAIISLDDGPNSNKSPRTNHTDADFIVGPENRLTAATILSLLNGEPAWFSPLVLYGPSGTGKSHLASCVAESQPDAVYTTGADFAHELATALDHNTIAEFRTKYRTAGLLVFEDLLQLTGRRAALQELQHLLDDFEAREAPVLITSLQPPADVAELPPSLRSRLSGGLVLSVASPGVAARETILQRWAAAQQIPLSSAAAKLLAERVGPGMSQLRAALHDLHLESLGNRLGAAPPIEADAVRQYLARHRAARRPHLNQISAVVAKHFGIPRRALSSPSRRRQVVLARAVAIYLGRTLCDASLKCLGNHFGGRDHTTVLHNFQQMQDRLNHDAPLRSTVETLQRALLGDP
jgi:chromosomal replication initiator protein